MKNGVERDHRSQHAREILAGVLQREGHDKGRPVIGRQSQGVAAKLNDLQLLRLQAGHKRALQRFRHEGVLLSAEIPLRCAGALARFSHRGQINEGAGVALDEILKQVRHLGFRGRVFHVVDQARKR